MYKKILLTLDGSRLAERVLPYVAELAAGTGAHVTVFHVDTPNDAPPVTEEYAVPSDDYMTEISARLAWLGAPSVDGARRSGDAHTQIVGYAEDNGYDLVAMATHGESGLGRWAFGSTADKVLHTSNLPMFLLRPSELANRDGKRIKCLVAPLDGSILAEIAIPVVADLAQRLAVPVSLVRAIPLPGTLAAGPEPYGFDPRVDAAVEAAAEAYLNETGKHLQAKGVEAATKLKRGYPPNQIIAHAESIPGAVVVMSSHGRSGVGRWILGSVADRVLRSGAAPVLLLRADSDRKD